MGGKALESLKETFTEMAKGPDEFIAAIQGVPAALLSKRPDEKNWSAREVVCHVRDTEEYFLERFLMILSFDEPVFSPADVQRWAFERQYLRNDAGEALAAFHKRRQENLEFLKGLAPGQWERTCIHKIRGRMTMRDYLNLVAGHDKNHLDQLKRALAGKP